MLDGEFLRLRNERDVLVKEYEAEYSDKLSGKVKFDVARLSAFLSVKFPSGPSLTEDVIAGYAPKSAIILRCMRALGLVKMDTPDGMKMMFAKRSFRNQVANFAANNGIEIARVSHLAILKILVEMRNPLLAKEIFSDS